ncbi:hypothetical protein HMPREF2534_03622 [Bacteroides thetaiotaomicron]|uniref:Uncharacterized protein n=1 Tax=Bacteroides fragilis str. 3976T8 TaxID=1339314 RepID=A0A016AU87_BACFG|nr:hypothetical protein M123_0661 [Bacteroides fragilis str. 3976T8]KXT33579.1 hypothetical protein HMPREF2534_03622 [Bacteroides thetaiotaomicron]
MKGKEDRLSTGWSLTSMPSTSGNKNRERIFSTNKPIGIITKG